MNRIEYRTALESRLAAVPSAERAKQLDYYDEMICDRMEDGMTEEEAVAMLGDIDETAREILSQYALPSPVSPAGADRPPAPDKENRGGGGRGGNRLRNRFALYRVGVLCAVRDRRGSGGGGDCAICGSAGEADLQRRSLSDKIHRTSDREAIKKVILWE